MDAGKMIMEALDRPEDEYPREAVQAAMEYRDDVVPLLLDLLERVLRAPEEFTYPDYESLLPVYAVYLLSHHRVPQAHRLLIGLASLPGQMPLDLFDDVVHEGFPVALWKTSGGDPARIKELIRLRDANEYCRAAAIRALTLGVAEGSLEREEVVAFLQGLFTGDEASPGESMVWNAAASALARLWPGESMEVLRRALEGRLIDPGFISMESIERRLEEGLEARMAAFTRRAQEDLQRTPHEELSHWACFNPDGFGDFPAELERELLAERRASDKKKRSKQKRKRKQARAARKKSRGKGKRRR